MAIHIIVAVDDKNGLSAHGKTPWHARADMQLFKRLTMGCTILMGHGTYNAIGHALPGRTNVVATYNAQLRLPDATTITDVVRFLQHVAGDQEVWVIGGAGLYAAALPFAKDVHLTHIPGNYHCDAFFPSLQHYTGKVIRYEVADLPSR